MVPFDAPPLPWIRVEQLPGLENLNVPVTVPDLTPPPTQFLVVPVDLIVASTFLELPAFGSGGVNVPLPVVTPQLVPPAAGAGVPVNVTSGTASAAALTRLRMV